ncbi:MAG: YbjN domain-containing protein [Pseudomonadota bacterium]
MAFAAAENRRTANPVDLVEHLAHQHDWSVERASEDELTLLIAGEWTDYHVSVNWRGDIETVHVASAFDFKVPEFRQAEIYRLLAQINEQLWLGHFDFWADDGLLMYRHGMPLAGSDLSVQQCEALLSGALESCERYYQAFQFVVWAGKGSREALVSTMFNTEGQA